MMDSDLGNRIQTTIIGEKRQLRLVVHYERIVDDRCVSQASRNQSGNTTKHWKFRLVNNTLSSFAPDVISSFSNFIQESFEHQVKAVCELGTNNSNRREASYGELSPAHHLEKIIHSTVRSLGEVCDTQVEKNLQTCIEIREFNIGAQWTEFVLHVLLIAFVTIFTYFGPAVVCLFSATEDTHEGIRQISVEGPSPVSIRSLIGNYFFSTDYTTWHMARKFIMRTVLLPIPFLAPALFVEYLLHQNLLPQQNMLRISYLFQPFRILCYGCYCIQAFYLHFLLGKPPDADRSCVFYESYHADGQLGDVWVCSTSEENDRTSPRSSVVFSAFMLGFWLCFTSIR